MQHHSKFRLWQRLGLVAATVGLAAGALIASSGGPAVASTTKITLDHFLCYTSTAKGFKVPPNIS